MHSPHPQKSKLTLAKLLAAAIAWGTSAASVSFAVTSESAKPLTPPNPSTFCIPVAEIRLSPFEDFGDPVRLFYLLLLTRSYISTDPAEFGILSQWQFSPDGLTLTARVSPEAHWQDGAPVTAREAAYSIAKALKFRPLGEKIWVKGTENINKPDWQSKEYAGIRILDSNAFELRFESTVDNPAGVLREALSTNARHNRLWAARIDSKHLREKPEIASKFPYRWEGTSIVADADGFPVKIYASNACSKSDMKLYSVPKGEESQYSVSKTQGQQAVIAVISPSGKLADRATRFQLAQWLRGAFKERQNGGFEITASHFGKLESGYIDGVNWGSSSTPPPSLHSLVITKGTTRNSPVILTVENAMKNAGINATYRPLSDSNIPAGEEIQIAGARIEGDRQIWMQDWLNASYFREVLSRYPKTRAALYDVVKKSSATVPTDQATLAALDKAAFEEASLVPIARFRVTIFTRTSSPVTIMFTDRDELTFKRRLQQ